VKKVYWEKAPDIEERIHFLVNELELEWIDTKRVHCFRSNNSKARAYARIWGFGQIWQMALDTKPRYCLEVLGEQFDHLPTKKQDTILLHELAHVPKTFSGALTPHTRRGKGSFHDKLERFITAYKRL